MKTKGAHNRILIVEVNWVGDVLLSTPLIRSVREKFKNAHIACLVHPRVKEVLKKNPRINEIIIYDEKHAHKSLLGKLRLTWELRRHRFDLAILLHRSFTKAFITYLAGIKKRAGYITGKRRLLITHPVDSADTPLHKVDYFLKVAGALGCDTGNRNCEFFINDTERRKIERVLAENGIGKGDFLVVLNPGGNWAPKRWPEENFACLAEGLIEKYGAKIAISGAKKDIERALRIKEKMKRPVTVLCGKTNLSELAALAERADFVISGDSGPMHVAVSMKSNVIAIFGPTSPSFTGPTGSGNYRVIQKDVSCEVPCYELACGDYKCMKAVTVYDVLSVFGEMYANTKGK